MEIKTYLNPKWWLIVFGAIFLVLGAGNYITADKAAETAYEDPTDRDVFYEQTFGLFSMGLAALALTTGLFVKGRGLSMLAMVSSVAMIVVFVLHYNAGEVVNYGYNDPMLTGVLGTLLALMGIGGYMHLEEDE
tara:strand:+ start:150 stop:551 length:402 start_codon:yes stop_codon:yes gene_type:complete